MTLRQVSLLILLHAALAAAILVAGIRAGRAEPAGYRAVTLLCPVGLDPAACGRGNALDVIAVTPALTPFACLMGGMDTAARAPALAAGGRLKIVCERR